MGTPGGGLQPPRSDGSVTVILTVLRDPRFVRTVESLLLQTRAPFEILIADGGQGNEVRELCQELARKDPRVVHLDAPGNIPESRNLALRAAKGEFVAFIDADELAPSTWLETLLRPFSDRHVGLTGGPTPAMPGTTRTITSRFYDAYLRRFYAEVAPHRPHALPMGNSAWRREVFARVGLLDVSLFRGRTGGSEDQDVAARAMEAGFYGVYVPEAGLLHDFADITLGSLLHKQRIYSESGYLVWRRRGTTYEASATRELPYVLPPLLIAIGLLLLVPASLREWGELLATLGAVALGVVAIGLTVVGVRLDRRYSGLRWNALEILRRWATLYGAFLGWALHLRSGEKKSPQPTGESG
jgi:glycosyltransferase involved in cell wall biosynthesis